MTNFNIPRAKIILSGNRPLAARYVRIATRRVMEFKQFLSAGNLQYGQKVLMFDRDCIWARLWTIDNNDFVRIHACAEGEVCGDYTFTADLTEVSSIQGGLVSVVFTVEKYNPHPTFGATATVFTNFGDGVTNIKTITENASPLSNTQGHRFWTPGLFDVSVDGYESRDSSGNNRVSFIPTGSVESFERVGDFFAWEGSFSDRDKDLTNSLAHANVIAKAWSPITVTNNDMMQQIINPSIGTAWDTGSGSGFRGYIYTQRYSVWTPDSSDILNNESLFGWLEAGCRQPDISGFQVIAMDPDLYDRRLNEPWPFLKVEFSNADTYFPKFENATSNRLYGADITDTLKALRDAGGTFTITFTSFDDWATPSGTPVDEPQSSRISPMGYESWIPWMWNMEISCKISKTKSEYITVT